MSGIRVRPDQSCRRKREMLSALSLLLTLVFAAGAQAQSQAISVRGQLRPAQHTVLSAGISTNLTEISVEVGSSFRKGEVLARMDCQERETEKEIVEARLHAARVRHEVNAKLAGLENISTLEVELSHSEVLVMEADLRRIEAVLDKCIVRAPFDGTVVEKLVQEFQFVNVGDPLLRLLNPEKLEIEAVVPSVALSTLAVGTEFSLLLDETGSSVQARIDRIVHEVEPVSQTVRIYGELMQPAGGVFPGMSGRILF